MTTRSEEIREAVGVFSKSEDLQAAIDELLSTGFHRAELSLLAGEDVVNEKLGRIYTSAGAVADDPAAPRAAYVSPEAIGDAQGGIVGGLIYAGATIAAGAIVISGGTVLAAVVAATVAAGAGGLVGAILAKWLGDNHAQYLKEQIRHGGLLLWVRTTNSKAERRAVDVLRRHSSRDVHVHTLSAGAAQA
ncbi:MAG TPA: hypothetical protein VJT13_16430 [Xanthobacteraceae bacterium]|nr:hypothetical protein [Xanthobacteraceae bacterium]